MRLWLKVKILDNFKTQRALALACSKTDNWISKIVLGIKDPSEEEKIMIAQKLGISVEQIESLFINKY
jgi:transcriptional regulator with XRE-family HTH domain